MLALKKEDGYTTEYIYTLPEGKRAELIDGVIYDMAPPSFKHQRLIHYISTEIELYIRAKKGLCKVVPAPFAVFLDANNKTYVEPDISVICDKNKIDDYGCNGAPDWIIEVASPSSKRLDYFTKLFKYQASRVREYWIVDPLKETIDVYYFESETMERYNFNEVVKVGIYEDLEIDFSKIE